ncbi:MAG TPA: hypothetical protein PK054_12605 [Anaerohalosphaeraceae bacterium]|nr:hypothetical protein [Anaerohalosphaeraceae bacterium]HOL90001.1 hypothetical protein [Anaerohalosphaeraceae bacterium]HPP57406.1 hypothetical protein [Anaerohalosphaeraceae bacterium]
MPNGSELDNRPATLGDINRLYNILTPMLETVAVIRERLEHNRRPCHELETIAEAMRQHIQKHENMQKTIADRILSSIIDGLKYALVGLVVYWLSSKGII